MKKYERYKDSGVQWLGMVPEHWEVMRFKHFMELITEPAKDGKKIGLENIESGTSKYIETESEFEGSGVDFKQNDIVYGKLRPYLRKVWQAEFDGNAVGDFFVFRNKKNSTAKYLKYLLLSEGFTSIATGSTEGAKMPRVSSQFILSLDYALPTINEQETIANYLDSQVSKINSVITEKEKMINDMEKYCSSLISETVTKGLNPDAPMKDSGVDWIGEVPEHWSTRKLKYCLCEKLQYGASESGTDFRDDFPRYIRITDITQDGKLKDIDKLSLAPKVAEPYLLKDGDILFARSGATVGKTFLYKEQYGESAFAGYLIKASVDTKKYVAQYVYYYTQGALYDQWKNSSYSQATIQNIGADKYSELIIPVPPLEEQQVIVEVLDKKMSYIDSLVSELKSQIENLKSYKQSLITEAVTGQVDVRDWTPNE